MNELPKGMLLTDMIDVKTPEPLSLRNNNYIAAIYRALELLPIELVILKCIILEKHRMSPEVRLTLQILGARTGVECHSVEISD